MRPRLTHVLVMLFVFASLAACAGAEEEGAANSEATNTEGEGAEEVEVAMQNTDGDDVGTVLMSQNGDMVSVESEFTDIEGPGYRGFHVHENAMCEPEDPEGAFMSAGDHYNPDGVDHSDHPGDFPPLLVNEDGTATSTTETDRFALEDLAEGAAVIVHADPDNSGHIPDRYTSDESGEPGPDEETLSTGDAGDRQACGVIGGGE